MISGFGWAALALLFGYLALFFWGSAVAAPATGIRVTINEHLSEQYVLDVAAAIRKVAQHYAV